MRRARSYSGALKGPDACSDAAKRSNVLEVVASGADLLVCGTDFLASCPSEVVKSAIEKNLQMTAMLYAPL